LLIAVVILVKLQALRAPADQEPQSELQTANEQTSPVSVTSKPTGENDLSSGSEPQASAESRATSSAKTLPRLVDLGAGHCIPCKEMAPILEELKNELKGKVVVEVIDLNENPSAADEYRIRVIPTQIFFSADGEELYRHEGFFPKEDILAKLTELGMLTKKGESR
jgi:thioredoxin 1